MSHHPRSPSASSVTFGQLPSSLTLNSNLSSQSLVPTLQLTGPSTSQFSLPIASSSTTLPAFNNFPPVHLRASNNVCIQRDSATITGSFLIDPSLQVPDCLLPDDPDVLLPRASRLSRDTGGKGKQKRANVCLITRTGDICVDIWVREGSSRPRTDANRAHGSTAYSTSQGSSNNDPMNSPSFSEYWGPSWTSPPPSHPWPDKIKARTEIDIRSETGSVIVRIVSSYFRQTFMRSVAHPQFRMPILSCSMVNLTSASEYTLARHRDLLLLAFHALSWAMF